MPTGNFGNILAAYYAKQMGVPIDKLICASNENKVLYDFFTTGTYDRNREFILTSSPSMDILISSNLERLIYHLTGDDSEQNRAFMDALSKRRKVYHYRCDEDKACRFYGNYAGEEETAQTIRRIYETAGYIIDTHTAVAASVYQKYKRDMRDDKRHCLRPRQARLSSQEA